MDIRVPPSTSKIQKKHLRKIGTKNKGYFSVNKDQENNKISSSSQIHSVAPLFYEEDTQQKKKRSIARGKGILNELTKLHGEVLQGNITPATLKNLELLLGKTEHMDLPENLQLILDEIETRASVEMEKIKQNLQK